MLASGPQQLTLAQNASSLCCATCDVRWGGLAAAKCCSAEQSECGSDPRPLCSCARKAAQPGWGPGPWRRPAAPVSCSHMRLRLRSLEWALVSCLFL